MRNEKEQARSLVGMGILCVESMAMMVRNPFSCESLDQKDRKAK